MAVVSAGSRRLSSWTLPVWSLLIGLYAAHLLLAALYPRYLTSTTYFEEVCKALIMFSFASIGALISRRRPENRIGVIFMGVALLAVLDLADLDFAQYALAGQGELYNLGVVAVWVASWIGVILFAYSLFFPLLYFPDGKLPTPRWRWVVVFLVALTSVQVAANMLLSGPLAGFPNLQNPFGVPAWHDLCEWLNTAAYYLGGAAIGVSALSLILRYRRAQDVEKLQLRWLAYGAAAPQVILAVVSNFVPNDPAAPTSILLTVMLFFSLIMVPVTVGIAILRYHLYYIDVIIRRTLVYAVVTAVLSLVYFSGVTVFQGLFSGLSGQTSPAALVISTLAIAALFNPLRRRVQEFIDRRFYRSKYDAERALADFAAAARAETDLDALNNKLVQVAQENLQPARVGLWMIRIKKSVS